MKEFIIYTLQGTTNAPNLDVEVENCQVLGIIQADSAGDAINKLFEKNKWISESGFTKDCAIVKQLFSSLNIKDLNRIIDYLWRKEYDHFQDNNYPENHIFRILKRLKESV